MSDEIVGQCQCGASLTPYHKCQGGVTSGGTMTPERLTPEREDVRCEMCGCGLWKTEQCSNSDCTCHRDLPTASIDGTEVSALRSQVDELAGALQVYADRNNWNCPRCHKIDPINCFMGHWTGPCEEHAYEVAEAALSNPAIAQQLADAELLKDAIDDLPDASNSNSYIVPTSLQVLRVKSASKQYFKRKK